MILSILTITFDDELGLLRTRDSLMGLLGEGASEVEWLVQDGGSDYDVVAAVGALPSARVVSQPDEGLYDAMNRALSRSTGQWVWMLNGGDECLEREWHVLRKDLMVAGDGILLYDFEQVIGDKVRTRRARSWSDMRHSLPTSHQAMLFPGDEARRIGYSTQYLAGDYHHAARLMKAGIRGVQMGRPIARFHIGGRSTTDVRQVARDARQVQRLVLEQSLGWVALSQLRHAVARTRLKMRLGSVG